jgi:DNA-binding NarL/FixJ family response regulator
MLIGKFKAVGESMNFAKSNSSKGTSKSQYDLHLKNDQPVSKPKLRRSDSLILIDERTLERECFVRSIEMSHPRITVHGYSTIEDWRTAVDPEPDPTAILLNIGSRRVTDPSVGTEVERLVADALPTPVIVLAQSEDLGEMIAAVDHGARGYIPASVGFDVILEATRLTSVGGMYLPAASVLSLRHTISPKPEPSHGVVEHFTARQSEVAHALRRGRANKIIAYELNMSESTVKIHIRNIMKKLKATNRTEAAFKLNALFASQKDEID